MEKTDRSKQLQASDAGSIMRLARFLAMAGIASRRKAEELLTDGRVTVNGIAVLTPATTVNPATDTVCVEGRRVHLESFHTVMLNKPAGYTCSMKDDHAEHLVYELIPAQFGRLFSIGRLDRDSEGLLLFTNDGELAQHLTHPSFEITKTYVVDCNGTLTKEATDMMLNGVIDDGDFLKARSVRVLKSKPHQVLLEMTLSEGKKREVRRLCRQAGLFVVQLTRVAFSTLRLGDLPSGKCRELTANEISALKQGTRKTWNTQRT